MLDIRFIREQPDVVQAGARKKRIDIDIRQLLEVDEQRRRLQGRVEHLKAPAQPRCPGRLPPCKANPSRRQSPR